MRRLYPTLIERAAKTERPVCLLINDLERAGETAANKAYC